MNNKLFVGGISFSTTEDRLAQLFAEIGELQSIKIITDRDTGRSRGFGFVEMTSEEDAQAAIEKFNGFELDGRDLSVKVAEERRPYDRKRSNFGGDNSYRRERY